MKKICFLTLALVLTLTMTACDFRPNGMLGGVDDKANVLGGENKDSMQNKTEKEHVKAVMIDGSIYYETDEDKDINEKRDNFDGSFKKAVDAWELPKNNGESNFDLKSKECGYWLGSLEGTIEILIGDDLEIFKKLETEQDISKYKYILKVEGKAENKNDMEYIVLSNNLDITINDVENKELNSQDKSILVIESEWD